MRPQRRWIPLVILPFIFVMLFAVGLISRNYDYLPIDLSKISSFDNERISFQRVEQSTDLTRDNSFESLLVIRKRMMYLIMDGYDSPYLANLRKVKIAIQKTYGENENDLIWPNRINGKPDFVQVADRHNELMKTSTEETVSTNHGAFYKSIREKFIREHVQKFRQLMRNRDESELFVDVTLLPRPLWAADREKYPDKHYIFAKARALDGTTYSCEDADGDNVTETFMVDGRDGYNWGYKSGANIIFIYKNSEKEIENLIGKLAHEAVYGSAEDEKEMFEKFPKEKDIDALIKWLTPKEPNYR
jgi:hypothetical protein